MPIRPCRYCLEDVETKGTVRHPVCVSCQRKHQTKEVKRWYEKTGKRRERVVTVARDIKETMYYPWKFDQSVILVIEP